MHVDVCRRQLEPLSPLADVSSFAAELDTLSEESYKDSTLIMQLLRDNLVCGAPFIVVLLSDCVGHASHWTRQTNRCVPKRLYGPPRRPRLVRLRRRLRPRKRPRSRRHPPRSPRQTKLRHSLPGRIRDAVFGGTPGAHGVYGVCSETSFPCGTQTHHPFLSINRQGMAGLARWSCRLEGLWQ